MSMSFGQAMERRARNKDTELAQQWDRNRIAWQKLEDDYALGTGALGNNAAQSPQGLKPATKSPTFLGKGTLEQNTIDGNRQPEPMGGMPQSSVFKNSANTYSDTNTAGSTFLSQPTAQPNNMTDDQWNQHALGMFLGGLIGKDKKPVDQPKPPQTPPQPEMLGTGKARSAAELLRPGARQKQLEEQLKAQGLRRGTSYVYDNPAGVNQVVDPTGNGHPTKDSVPANLAQGEAVVNAGGMEIPGMRDFVAFINEVGAEKLGLKGAAKTKDGVLHAAAGTIDVRHLSGAAEDTAMKKYFLPNADVRHLGGTVQDAAMKKYFPNAANVITPQEVHANMAARKTVEQLSKDAARVNAYSDALARGTVGAGSVPPGAVPPGAVPHGAVPPGAVPPGQPGFGQRWKQAMRDGFAADAAKAEKVGKYVGGKLGSAVKFGAKATPYLAAGYEAYNAAKDISQTPEGERARFAAGRGLETVGRFAGAYGLGKTGAITGGLVAGPPGAVVGGVLGAGAGYFLPDLGYTTKDEANDRRAAMEQTLTPEASPLLEQSKGFYTVGPDGKLIRHDAAGNQVGDQVGNRWTNVNQQQVDPDEAGYSQFFNKQGITDEMRANPEKHGLRRMEGTGGNVIYRRGNEYIGMGAPSRIAAEEARANDPAVKRAAAMEQLREYGMAGNKEAAAMYNAMVKEDTDRYVASTGLDAERIKAGVTKGKQGDDYKIMDRLIDSDDFKIPVFNKDGQQTGSTDSTEEKQAFKTFVRNQIAQGRKMNPNLQLPFDDPEMMESLIGEFLTDFKGLQAVRGYGRENAVNYRDIEGGLSSAKKIPDLTIHDWFDNRMKGVSGSHTLYNAITDNLWNPSGGVRYVGSDGTTGVTVPNAAGLGLGDLSGSALKRRIQEDE